MINEYQDGDIGRANPEDLQNFGDEIDQDEFDDILQEFINENSTLCKKLLEKYKDNEFDHKVRVGSDPKEFLNTTKEIKAAAFKLLKLKNGEFVRLVSKEQMVSISTILMYWA